MNPKFLHKFRDSGMTLFMTLLTLSLLVIYLSPFAFMVFTSLKTQAQISIVGAPIWPAAPSMFTYKEKEVETFMVPLANA